MKAKSVFFSPQGEVKLVEKELEAPQNGQIQVEMEASQLSPGTELSNLRKFKAEPTDDGTGDYPGYSIAGYVKDVGEGVTEFKKGDRVMAMGTGQAYHADFSNVNQNLCLGLPDEMSFEDGANVALVLTSMQACRRLDPSFGETHIIAGMGLVGQYCSQILNFAGVNTVVLDIADFRLDIAKDNGATLSVKSLVDADKKAILDLTNQDGLDGGILCFGGEGTETLHGIHELMTTTPDTHAVGPLVVVGGCFLNIQLAAVLGNIDIRSSARTGPGYKDDAWERGQEYPRGWVRWDTKRQMRLFRDMCVSGKFRLDNLNTHRYKLEDAPEIYRTLTEAPVADMLGIFFTK